MGHVGTVPSNADFRERDGGANLTLESLDGARNMLDCFSGYYNQNQKLSNLFSFSYI